MKNHIKIKYFVLLFSSILFLSCEKEEEQTSYSTLVVAQGVTATISLVAPLAASQTINENDEGTYKFKVTLNKSQTVPVKVFVKQIGGNADDNDYKVTKEVTVDANSLTGEGSITFKNNDEEAEDLETLKLKIGLENTSNATITNSTELNFSINNFLSSTLDLTFNWDKSFSISGAPFELYKIKYDIDYEIYNSLGVDTGNTEAQTNSYPEKVKINPATFPNGIYTVKYVVFQTGILTGTVPTPTSGLDKNFHDPFIVPINVDYIRVGDPLRGNKVSLSKPLSTSVPTTTGEVIKFKVINGNYEIL